MTPLGTSAVDSHIAAFPASELAPICLEWQFVAPNPPIQRVRVRAIRDFRPDLDPEAGPGDPLTQATQATCA